MSSSIQTILSSINKYTDLARAARFLVTFGGLPSGYGAEEVETLQLRCENVNLPGKIGRAHV